MAGKEPRGLSRRELLGRASTLGAAALVASALPIAERMIAASPALAHQPGGADGLALQAFADTIIPGRPATRTDLGDPIDPRVIAGVDGAPGAVEADVLRLFQDELLGFPTLAPAFLADLTARSLAVGGNPLFVDLDFERRTNVVKAGLDFANPDRVLWEAAAAFPFTAFCAAGTQPNATSKTASGYRVMGLPGAAPNGYRDFSYRRKLATGRTRNGNLG
jgi:hypothetical protein